MQSKTNNINCFDNIATYLIKATNNEKKMVSGFFLIIAIYII